MQSTDFYIQKVFHANCNSFRFGANQFFENVTESAVPLIFWFEPAAPNNNFFIVKRGFRYTALNSNVTGH